MKRRMSAISSSRPRGGPSPCANASEPFLLAASSHTTRLSGMSEAITFQVAREFNNARFSHAS